MPYLAPGDCPETKLSAKYATEKKVERIIVYSLPGTRKDLLPSDVPRVFVGEELSLVELSRHFETLVEDLQIEKVPTALFVLNPLLHTHSALEKVLLNGKHFNTALYLGNVAKPTPFLRSNCEVF